MKVVAQTPLWLWPNLLSLDAPLVAVLWQDFVARCYPSVLLPAGRWTLGLTVWSIYLADRLIDVRAGGGESWRHDFWRSHRALGGLLLGVAVTADAYVALRWLRPAVFSNGLWVGAAVTFYLVLFALRRVDVERSKQVCAAMLFTAGIFLVAWTSTQHAWSTLLAPASAFGALCLGNLILIENWEQGRRVSRAVVWAVAALAVVALCGGSRWYTAVGVSAAGLLALQLAGTRLPEAVRHVLADVVLMTPFFL